MSKSGTWLVPSVEDAAACKRLGGKLEKGVCMLVKGPDGGWTAPVKGSYFSYGVDDLYEATGDKRYKGKYFPRVVGCIVADSPVYPQFAGMCSSIYEGEFYDEMSDKEEALNDAKNEVMSITKDVLQGDASYWGMDYYLPSGRKAKYDEENAIVANDRDLVVRVFKHPHQKSIEDFLKIKKRK